MKSINVDIALAALLATLVFISVANAGEFNQVLSIGDAGPAWKDLPGTDGKSHSLADLKDKRFVVVVFPCASCPTAVDYEARISRLAVDYAEKSVAVVPICVNQVKQDQLSALTERVEQEKLGFHYLYDASQKIATDYGAIFTPEFFVLDQDRRVVYMGALDDEADAAKVTQKWVEQALAAGFSGKTPGTAETIARGCRIRYARKRGGE